MVDDFDVIADRAERERFLAGGVVKIVGGRGRLPGDLDGGGVDGRELELGGERGVEREDTGRRLAGSGIAGAAEGAGAIAGDSACLMRRLALRVCFVRGDDRGMSSLRGC